MQPGKSQASRVVVAFMAESARDQKALSGGNTVDELTPQQRFALEQTLTLRLPE